MVRLAAFSSWSTEASGVQPPTCTQFSHQLMPLLAAAASSSAGVKEAGFGRHAEGQRLSAGGLP